MASLADAAREFLAQKRIAVAGVSHRDHPGQLSDDVLRAGGFRTQMHAVDFPGDGARRTSQGAH